MKKTVVLLLLTAALLTVTACGDTGAAETPAAEAPAAEPLPAAPVSAAAPEAPAAPEPEIITGAEACMNALRTLGFREVDPGRYASDIEKIEGVTGVSATPTVMEITDAGFHESVDVQWIVNAMGY